MSGKLLVFGGTTEGRELIQLWSVAPGSTPAIYCAATDYGAKLVEKLANVKFLTGRLDDSQMAELFRSECVTHVVDATHPYAALVTANIRRACEATGARYIRVTRPRTELLGETVVVDTPAEAAELLNKSNEKVLLTVGSKELPEFAGVKNAAERLYARVLPTSKVLAQCELLGYDAGHLIALQGPFGTQMNEQMLAMTGARTLVTKDGGEAGGMAAKLRAAQNRGVRVIVIGRADEDGLTVAEALLQLRREMELPAPPPFPMLLPLEGKKCLFVGGGSIALRRARTLRRCAADVHAVALDFCDGWGDVGAKLERRGWREDDLAGAALVVAATDDRQQNHAIAEAAKRLGIPVSVADRAAEGSFYFPALVTSNGAEVAVSTGGADPALTHRLADALRKLWPGLVAEAKRAASAPESLSASARKLAPTAAAPVLELAPKYATGFVPKEEKKK